MTVEQKAEIFRLRSLGWSAKGIAKRVGISEAEVARTLGDTHLLTQISRGVGQSPPTRR